MDYKSKYLKYKNKYLNLKKKGGNLVEGEIWFYSSGSCDGEIGKKHNGGHLGISLDRKSDQILAFGPTRPFKKEEKSVEGDVQNDTQMFEEFFNYCSNENRPLFILNIKYEQEKGDELKKIYKEKEQFQYSDPMKGGNVFTENFKDKYQYNNCITFITNVIDPLVDIGDKSFKIVHKYSDKYGEYQYLPGGWISEFVKIYGDYSRKIYK
jgi:hypothetical protein